MGPKNVVKKMYAPIPGNGSYSVVSCYVQFFGNNWLPEILPRLIDEQLFHTLEINNKLSMVFLGPESKAKKSVITNSGKWFQRCL